MAAPRKNPVSFELSIVLETHQKQPTLIVANTMPTVLSKFDIGKTHTSHTCTNDFTKSQEWTDFWDKYWSPTIVPRKTITSKITVHFKKDKAEYDRQYKYFKKNPNATICPPKYSYIKPYPSRQTNGTNQTSKITVRNKDNSLVASGRWCGCACSSASRRRRMPTSAW
eukprot:SAG31_NODE_2365_length_5859_cov_22.319097_4_plen_168_part_00